MIKEFAQSSDREYWYPVLLGNLEQELSNFFRTKGFSHISMPLINHSVAKKSINFHLQIDKNDFELSSSNALRLGYASTIYGKVFCLSSVFRNEKALSKNHLREFRVIEAEWPEEDFNKLISFVEEMFLFGIDVYNKFIRENSLTTIFSLKSIDKIRKVFFSDIIPNGKMNGKPISMRQNEHYVPIVKEPTIIMFYPPQMSWRAKRIDKEKSLIFNLILPDDYGELVEFSLRETNPDIIANKFRAANILEEYQWYVDGLRHNSSVSVGLGMGIERFVIWLVEGKSVSDMRLFNL
jgi:aspartyl/asparaginyl-tRNA synthetase